MKHFSLAAILLMSSACATTASDPAYAVIKSAKTQDFTQQSLEQKTQSAIAIQDDLFAALSPKQVASLALRGSPIWEGCPVYSDGAMQYYKAKGQSDRYASEHITSALYKNMHEKLAVHASYQQKPIDLADEMRGAVLSKDEQTKALVLSIGCSTAIGLSTSSDDNTLAKIMSSPVGLVTRSGDST